MLESAPCKRYEVDPSASFVKVVTRTSLHDVNGRGPVHGYIEASFFGDRLARDTPIRAHFEVPVAELDSGNAAQDREMHKIMGSKSFPNIVADLVEATPRDSANHYGVTSEIGVRGTTRTIGGDIAIRQRDGRVEIDGERRIDIRTFGIQPPRILIFQVSPEILVTLHVVANLKE